MNAKELSLAALNATSNLADIYTYLMSLGVPFKAISEIMISPEFNFIANLMEDDAYDEDLKALRIKDALDIFCNNAYLGDLQVLWSCTTDSTSTPPTVSFFQNQVNEWTEDDFRDALKKIEDKLAGAKAKREINFEDFWDDDNEPDIDAFLERDEEEGSSRQFISNYNPSKNELAKARQCILDILACMKYKEKYHPDLTGLSTIANALPNINAYEIMGGIAGINKGLKSKEYDQYKWRTRIESFYGQDFSLLKYLTDEEFRNQVDRDLGHSPNKNPLYLIYRVPHYKEMLNAWAINEEAVFLTSTKHKVVDSITKSLKNNRVQITDKAYKAVQDCTDEAIVLKWLRGKQIEVMLDTNSGKYQSGRLNTDPIVPLEQRIVLDSVDDIATFKHFMETTVLTRLRTIYPNNAFVKALTTSTKRERNSIVSSMHFDISLSDVDKSTFLQNRYKEILDGFNEICGMMVTPANEHLSIGDAFYLYNLIVNKDKPGARTMTRLFETFVATTTGENSLCMDYYRYIIELDKDFNADNEFSSSNGFLQDCEDYIDALENGTNVQVNPDATFRLPNYFGEYRWSFKDLSKQSNTRHIQYTNSEGKGITMTLKDTLDVFCEKLGIKSIGEDSDSVFALYNSQHVDDANTAENPSDIQQLFKKNPMKYKNARAFIYNGKIYINGDNADVTDPLHEWMHLILAGMKYNPDTAETYYNMMLVINSEYNTGNGFIKHIAQNYPDAQGSDLCEEIFVNLCQMYVRDIYFTKGDMLGEFMTMIEGTNDNNPSKFMQALLTKVFERIKDKVNQLGLENNGQVAEVSLERFALAIDGVDVTKSFASSADKVLSYKVFSQYSNQIKELRGRLSKKAPKDLSQDNGDSYLVKVCNN